ncbi:Protein dj-1beta [Eumeta japonica]|uniref:Protein dj-1beta n=1 Tax=Eumeta variegata TaxID=151549 RepID=A0A4C1UXH0_EUMVA|nr:Protein dj-1beta [Eumeta japonica]
MIEILKGGLVPILMYGNEKRVLQKKYGSRIIALEMRSLLSIRGVSLKGICRNSHVREQYCLKDAVTRVEKAPTAFVAHGVAKGKKVTSYPSTKDKIPSAEYSYIEGERVVVDGNIVTSRGPGTAYWFGLKLIEMLTGKDKADQVEKGMLISGY